MHRQTSARILGLGLLALAGSAAIAQAPAFKMPPGDPDVQCMIASNIFAQRDTDPKRKQVAEVASFFYLGRADARLSLPALKAKLVEQNKTLNVQLLGQIMNSCAQRMVAKQQQMQELGREMLASQPKSATPPQTPAPAPAPYSPPPK